MKLNIYVALPNKNIQSDQFPIIDSIKRLEEFLKPRLVKENTDISLCIESNLISEVKNRATFLLAIHDCISEDLQNHFKENPNQFVITFYLSVPFSGTLVIESFDKLFGNDSSINLIEKKIYEYLKSIDDDPEQNIDTLREECVKNLNLDCSLKDKLLYTSQLGYIYSYIDNQIEEHREKIQAKMIADIKKVREEAEQVISNELDLVNDSLKRVLKDEVDADNKILKCVYNNEEISSDEMILKLKSHVFNEPSSEEVAITSTLDDEYRIDMEKTIIIRSKGGGIKVSRRN